MFLASGTAAVGIAASAADGDEAGGQNWAFSLELFLAGLKEAADQGGVFWNLHRFTGAVKEAQKLNSIKAYQLQAPNRSLRQLFWKGELTRYPGLTKRPGCPAAGKKPEIVKKPNYSRKTLAPPPQANRTLWPEVRKHQRPKCEIQLCHGADRPSSPTSLRLYPQAGPQLIPASEVLVMPKLSVTLEESKPSGCASRELTHYMFFFRIGERSPKPLLGVGLNQQAI